MSALSRSSDALIRSSTGSSSNDGDKSPHDSSGGSSSSNGRRLVRSLLLKAACVAGGVFLLKKFTKSATPWDHARVVSDILIGEKLSSEQAARDPMTYFNLRLIACPATILADGSRVLYFEQAFWRTPERPYRQRFYVVKPCPKDVKCDVEVASYAIRDVEEYKNYCDRAKSQRPQAEEIIGDIAEHLTSVYLSRCQRGQQCLYEGSTPPGGYPNAWNGASRCTSELTIYKNGELHCWDRGYDEEGNQVWGVQQGPYEFKPCRLSGSSRPILESDYLSSYSTGSGHMESYE